MWKTNFSFSFFSPVVVIKCFNISITTYDGLFHTNPRHLHTFKLTNRPIVCQEKECQTKQTGWHISHSNCLYKPIDDRRRKPSVCPSDSVSTVSSHCQITAVMLRSHHFWWGKNGFRFVPIFRELSPSLNTLKYLFMDWSGGWGL